MRRLEISVFAMSLGVLVAAPGEARSRPIGTAPGATEPSVRCLGQCWEENQGFESAYFLLESAESEPGARDVVEGRCTSLAIGGYTRRLAEVRCEPIEHPAMWICDTECVTSVGYGESAYRSSAKMTGYGESELLAHFELAKMCRHFTLPGTSSVPGPVSCRRL